MNYFRNACRTASWICANQHEHSAECSPGTHELYDMTEDMNHGRYVRNYSLSEGRILHYSTNWISGMTIYGLAMLYDYFKEERYLESAVTGSVYLCALQNTLEGVSGYGAINERFPGNRWCAPRDGISASWGFLRLYHSTGRTEFLQRAELYADWHMNNVFVNDYPAAYVMFDKPHKDATVYNCQGGSGLFYYDLYSLTGKRRYREVMQQLADKYIEYFISEDGSLGVEFDPGTKQKSLSEEETPWGDMHRFNDDFGALALLAMYRVSGDDKYLDAVTAYMDWVMSVQHPEGGFGKYSHAVSSCVAALNLLNIFLTTRKDNYKNSAFKAIEHLEKFVVIAPENPAIHGGIRGMNVCDVAEDVLSLRVSMYAMYLYLLAGIVENMSLPTDTKVEIPDSVIHNPMFIGLEFISK